MIPPGTALGAALLFCAVGPESVGKPHGTTRGLLQFRGNPTHTWYGEGPLPKKPKVLWRFPRGEERMCATSIEGTRERLWCGTGWTGQPVVWERPDGKTEIIFGGFDKKVHFLDAERGIRIRPDFPTNDIIKGSVTLDPDGFPLLYFGSRDNRLRILALDRRRPRVLWALRAAQYPGLWNNDWDANPSVVDDVLYEGGENGFLFAVRLNRSWADDGERVRVDPEIQVAFKGWTKELVRSVGDRNSSIESSPVVFGQRVYAANSQGRVFGLDVSALATTTTGEVEAPLVFDYWTGDDTDASMVVDEEGMLYVSVEYERKTERSAEVGQLLKLDPSKPEAPLVWGLKVPGLPGDRKGGGIWSTPALGHGVLYVTSQSGRFMVIDRRTGAVLWEERHGKHLWSSPVVVGDELLLATCKGELRAYSIVDPTTPVLQWALRIGGGKCIESTPAVWGGKIYVGTWDGHFYAVGEKPPQPRASVE
jgi:outer membrane protein assembly factor BamB